MVLFLKDEARAVQLYNWTCQSVAKYSILTQKAYNDLERIKAKHSNKSKLIKEAKVRDKEAKYDGDVVICKKLKDLPNDQIVVYPRTSNDTKAEMKTKASFVKQRKNGEEDQSESESDSDEDYQPIVKKQKNGLGNAQRADVKRRSHCVLGTEEDVAKEEKGKNTVKTKERLVS